jgi:hypothetical protein
MPPTSRFQKADMLTFAVSISSFQDSRFPVIDSVWESEIPRPPGKCRFMAGKSKRAGSDRYFTCGQDHDKRNRDWKPFQILERHCLDEGYDFYEAKDLIEERICRRLVCECEIFK